MNKITFPLRPQMQGATVADLQDALKVCVDRSALLANDESARRELSAALIPERNAQSYGRTTTRLVGAFQRERHLEARGEVDEPTANALNSLLTEWGLLDQPPEPATEDTFVVRGTLKNADGSPVPRAMIEAFDQGLRTRPISLAKAPTRPDGKYEIRYRSDQLRPEGKLAADLTVRAFDEAGNELAHSDFNCHALPEVTVDLVVGNVPLRGPTEYKQLLNAITPYLGRTKLADLERDDVAFLSCSARKNRLQVATLVVANRLAGETSLPDWLFYALGRQGVELQLTAMLTLTATRLREAFDRAISTNIVASVDEDTESALLDRLDAALLKEAFREDLPSGTFSVAAWLKTTVSVDHSTHREFYSRWLRRTSVEDFWKSLEEDERFKGKVLEDLRFTLVLGRLTGYLIPALQQLKGLRQRRELAKLSDLAKLTRPRWRELLRNAAGEGELELPDDVTGANYAERVENYISGIRNTIETMLPGESLRVALQTAPEATDALRVFLQNSDSLDLYWDNIDAKLAERGEGAFHGIDRAQREGVVHHAKALQRLVRLTPHPDHVRILQAAGFHSAYSIARTPKQRFNKMFAEAAQQLWDSLDGGYTIEVPADNTEVDS